MLQRCLLTLVIAVLLALQVQSAVAAANQAIEHIVIIWLKQPGLDDAQDTIIKASQALKTIPGVLALKSGKAVPSPRNIVDSSFDVALIISFIDQAALDAYLTHPVHLQLLEETMKPLVDRIRVYDLK
jgi:ABC-type sugar transport system substrate-binding protein